MAGVPLSRHPTVAPGQAAWCPRPAPVLRRFVFFLVAGLLVLLAGLSAGRAQTPEPAPATDIDLSQLTGEERAELLSRLSDEQVRAMIMSYLREQAATDVQQAGMMEEFDQGFRLFRESMALRLSHLGELPSVPGLLYDRLSAGKGPYHPLIVLGFLIVIAALAYVAERGYRRGVRRIYDGLVLPAAGDPLQRLGRSLARLCLDLIGVAVFAVALLILFFLFYHGHEPSRLVMIALLATVLVMRVTSAVSRFFFAPQSGDLRIAPFDDEAALRVHRWIVTVATVTAFGLLACALMLRLGVSPVLHALLLNLVGAVVVVLLVAGALSLRKPIAAALLSQVGSEGHGQRLLAVLASLWYAVFIVYVLVIYALNLYKGVVGTSAAAYPGLLSLLIVVLLPAADYLLRSLLDHFFPVEKTSERRKTAGAMPVFKRAARILLVILAIFLLGEVWGVNFFALGRNSFGEELMRAIVDIALTLLVAYVAWGAIKAALSGYLPAEDEEGEGGDEGGHSGATRLETVMPLVMRFIQITLAVIVVMILLSSLGVDIGPLLAGAGVIGLAVGFGAQTLVRDVVSGLFFLMDDAFRKGEYVDIGSVKGTVEGINPRSLVLRHHLGPVHTVPYGEIQHLTNFSRDWVIVKMEFRVPTDTDINKIKKIFKQIGAEMLENPLLGPDFLEPFKSQGVKAIEDSAIIVRGKFMSKPGTQFSIRKELYNRVQKAFHENGIEFAHRKVTVELPTDANLSPEEEKRLADAAGAAAIAAEEAEKTAQGQAPTR